ELAAYYAERYRKDYHGEETPSPRRVMRAWKNGARIAARLAKAFAPGARLFEVGAGIGCTVKNLELLGFDAFGIEPNRGFQRYTAEKLGARVENKNLYELEPRPIADGVLLVHVIEHFASARRALSHIHALLRDGGKLYLECPNLTAPFTYFPRMFHYAHVHNFSPKTLVAMAEVCGFRLERMYTAPDDPNIEALFAKAEPRPLDRKLLAGHAEEVLAAIRRYGWWGYHLRPAYLARRAKKLAGYAWEYLAAPYFERRLLSTLAHR
ncbi:MAG: class I SAM-dependent methyltransferase, partial [Zetaproteobacteria bacterium]